MDTITPKAFFTLDGENPQVEPLIIEIVWVVKFLPVELRQTIFL